MFLSSVIVSDYTWRWCVPMRHITTAITQRGQITLPVEVQRLLGVHPRDKVTFEIDDGAVRLVPARFTLESAAASVLPPTRTEDFDRAVAEVMEEHAERVVSDLNQR
jgi:bifunctional DNA-binding transcriptional regulator/antitoxin component of YhaV-PrlF toxin-antitoxin module